MKTKKCGNPHCIHKGKLQPKSNFWKDSSKKKDGLCCHCKDCQKKRCKTPQYKNTQKEWHIKNPDYQIKYRKRKKTMEELLELPDEEFNKIMGITK